MTSGFAVVGPGRVGTALARRWRERGYTLLGFVGRRAETVARAVAFCGGGRPLALGELRAARFVLLSVGDGELEAVARAAAAAAVPARGSLWLHASGRHDLASLAPLRGAGARIGSLHPLVPFPDAAAGYRALAGQPAVLQGERRVLRLLAALARGAGLRPVAMQGGNRVLYHAACALAANGLTALFDTAGQMFRTSCSIDTAQADALVLALMRSALGACAELGPAAALSGPAQRGDGATLRAHLQAIASATPAAEPVYRALLAAAVDLAHRQGALNAAQRAALTRLLAAADEVGDG